jgi:hypothetical protein
MTSILRRFQLLAFLFFALFLVGCSELRGLKLLAPETFDLTPLAPNLYVAAQADSATREKLLNEGHLK